mgnify:CR=1 FL=1
MEKFARKCTATGKGMNEGYCVGDGDAYFKEQEDLIRYFRGDGSQYSNLDDEQLLNELYDNEEYYWTEWDIEEGENWYTSDGIESFDCFKCGEPNQVSPDFDYCTCCLTNL